MFLVECSDIAPIVRFIKGVFTLIQFAIPLGLIVMGAWDLGKAVFSSDDKEIKAATGKLIKRAIAAVAVFFLVLLVNVILGMVSDSSEDGTVMNCWNEVS